VTQINSEIQVAAQQNDILTSGRRIDLQLLGRQGIEEAWIDASGLHPTAISHATPSLAYALKLAETKLANPNAKVTDSSQPILDRASLKIRTYQPLVDVANRQTHARDREKAPTFFPAIFSNFGELSSGMFLLVEWIVKEYRALKTADKLSHPGLSINQATARFRTLCKDQIASSIGIGLGRMMDRAGLAVPAPRCQGSVRPNSAFMQTQHAGRAAQTSCA
jgi:hypothetical protein